MITRRDFLGASMGAGTAVAIGTSLPPWLALAAQKAKPASGDTILVVLQLGGGNDGLNTVVPFKDHEYARSRPTLKLAPRELHKISSSLGFHPRMQAFKRIYDQGWLSIIQGAGYPKQDRQHPGGMRAWQTAHPEDPHVETGWIGRAVDLVYRDDDGLVPAMFVGQVAPPQGVRAQRALVPAIRSIEQCFLQAGAGPRGAAIRQGLADSAQTPRAQPSPLVSFLQKTTAAAYADAARVEEVVRANKGQSNYPATGLAGNLRTVANLVRAEIGIRVFMTELGGSPIGGFDNHAGQGGNHAALLHELSESVAAFLDDLHGDRLLDRVLLVTISEFGRTVVENGRKGTDHGAAAPMFLAGGAVRGGLVGRHPSLTDLDAGGLRPHTDFRSVYATLLDCWLGWDSRAVLARDYPRLELLKTA